MDLDDLLEDELGLHDDDADVCGGTGEAIISERHRPDLIVTTPPLRSSELTGDLLRIAEVRYPAAAAKRALAELDANAQQVSPEHGAHTLIRRLSQSHRTIATIACASRMMWLTRMPYAVRSALGEEIPSRWV